MYPPLRPKLQKGERNICLQARQKSNKQFKKNQKSQDMKYLEVRPYRKHRFTKIIN
jgi:hypothetical protein